MAFDVISRPIEVDDFVFHYNYIYKVMSVGAKAIKVLIHPPSPTSKSKTILGYQCCLLLKDDVLMHILKTGRL